jgi:rhamnose transport system substrate-binding protein
MIRKTLLGIALAALLAALAGALLARPTGAAHRKYTIGSFTYVNMSRGDREAAKKLGVRVVFGLCRPCSDAGATRVYESMIARHVDAIVSDGFNRNLKPLFRKVRKAGILLISSGDDIAGRRDLWVSPSSPVSYARALADALAAQIGTKGEYAVLEQKDEYPGADRWGEIAVAYMRKAYPKLKLDGVVDGTGAGDETEVESIKSFMASHPNLKGLIGITPTETYMAAEAITQAGRIGQIFSAGNGGGSFTDPQLIGYVRTGAADVVYTSNPIKLGYLTVWAAHYLLTGHHFRPGAYQVGSPIGLVWYYGKHRELRLGQPLTVTKKNVDRYANKF